MEGDRLNRAGLRRPNFGGCHGTLSTKFNFWLSVRRFQGNHAHLYLVPV